MNELIIYAIFMGVVIVGGITFYVAFNWGYNVGHKDGHGAGFVEGYFTFRDELKERDDLNTWVPAPEDVDFTKAVEQAHINRARRLHVVQGGEQNAV